MDGAQPHKPMGLGRRRLGLARNDGKIVDLGNVMKWIATFAKVKMSNNGLAIISYK